jgi:hypothetical protein
MFVSMTASAQLTLNVFGELELARRGERVGLPHSNIPVSAPEQNGQWTNRR